jgi:hypothetical protein
VQTWLRSHWPLKRPYYVCSSVVVAVVVIVIIAISMEVVCQLKRWHIEAINRKSFVILY